jgi:hypothetical protein
MANLSRPVQILLLLTAVFAVAWFFVLRPKPVEDPGSSETTAAPGQTGPTGGAAGTGNANTAPGRAVDKAVAGANTASNDAGRAAGTDPSAAPSTPATPTPTPAPTTSTPSTTPPAPGTANPPATTTTKGLPAPVAKALDKKKVILLLFWNPTSADDKAVRSELKQVKRRGGKVYVASAPISQLARFGGITRGVQVLQAPTVVIVDKNRKASTITGYTDAKEIDQAVSDALAQSAAKKQS